MTTNEMKQDFNLTVHIGKLEHEIFAKIEFKDGKLSISGVEGPRRNGDCYGSCGQIIMSFKEYDWRGYASILDIKPSKDWNTDMIKKFMDIWDRWHLNDMKAGTPKQEKYLREHPINDALDHYGKAVQALTEVGLNPDPDLNYRYGSAWLREEVPADVITFLKSLPETDINPAWV